VEKWLAAISADLERLTGDLDDPRPDATQVHDARKSLKRLRALLRLAPKPATAAASQMLSQARELRQSLGGMRDADVMRATLAQLAPFLGPVADRIEHCLPHPDITREAMVELMSDRARSLKAALDATLSNLRAAVPASASRKDLARGAAQTFRKARRRWRRACETGRPEDLHALRGAATDHRYQLAFFAPVWPRIFEPWSREAQRLRDRLGQHQDIHTLAKAVAAATEVLDGDREIFTHLSEKRQKSLRRRSEPLAELLFGETASSFRRRLNACLTHPAPTGRRPVRRP
jgi:CHAD domain-containing protein